MQQQREEQLAHWIEAACLWEAEAGKAGNVHPGACFDDLTYDDFVRSAPLTAEKLSQVDSLGVSQVAFNAASAVQSTLQKNTNLGIILLLAPLAAVDQWSEVGEQLPEILSSLDVEDSRRIYAAINIAQPGGLSQVGQQDVSSVPTVSVREVMQLAANRDLIARQYVNNFDDVLGFGLERLKFWWGQTEGDRSNAVVLLHLDWMANYPDSLIARKCGNELAQQSSEKAKEILKDDWFRSGLSQQKFIEFDNWLRADGNKRNPGTSADLVAASLFAGFREGIIA